MPVVTIDELRNDPPRPPESAITPRPARPRSAPHSARCAGQAAEKRPPWAPFGYPGVDIGFDPKRVGRTD